MPESGIFRQLFLDMQYTERYTVIISKKGRGGMENRERILDCALRLFYQKGYDAVGIQEICQEAGVTKPTMYHYFGSKYGLLETLLKQQFEDLLLSLEQAAQFRGSVENMLRDFAAVLFDFVKAKNKAYLLFMSLAYSARENETYRAVYPYISRLYYLTVQMFEQALPVLGNMNGRQEQFAIGFLGLLNHYILFLGYRDLLDEKNAVPEERRNSLVHQFMHGIYS